MPKLNKLTRAINPMSEEIRDALIKCGLMERFKQRPAYQQNDYIGWINRAKRNETKQKRLQQMLRELERGGVYMNMKHLSSAISE